MRRPSTLFTNASQGRLFQTRYHRSTTTRWIGSGSTSPFVVPLHLVVVDRWRVSEPSMFQVMKLICSQVSIGDFFCALSTAASLLPAAVSRLHFRCSRDCDPVESESHKVFEPRQLAFEAGVVSKFVQLSKSDNDRDHRAEPAIIHSKNTRKSGFACITLLFPDFSGLYPCGKCSKILRRWNINQVTDTKQNSTLALVE